MQSPSLSEIKKELLAASPEELVEFCLLLSRHNKENKELLHYHLFWKDNEAAYIRSVSELIDEEFSQVNTQSVYLAKKSIRRILKLLNKYIKYSGKKETEIDLLLLFCQKLIEMELPILENQVLNNLYQRQLQKVKKGISGFHEDLQFDYRQQLEQLEEAGRWAK